MMLGINYYWMFSTVIVGLGNPGVFNYCNWLDKQGVSGTFFVMDHSLVRRSRIPVVIQWFANIPKRIMAHLRILSPRHAPVIYTMIFGAQQDFIHKTMKDDFQGLGLIHLLVVSGAQISLITVVIWRLLRVFRCHPYGCMVVLIIVQSMYVSIVGLDASILRSLLMLDCFIWHRYIMLRRYPMWCICGLRAWHCDYYSRSILFVGFWYSFFITFNLMMVMPWLMVGISGPLWFVGYTLASIVAVVSSFQFRFIQFSG